LPAPRAAVPCRPYEPSQNSPCPSTIQASCPPEGPLVPHATFISDAFGLLSTTSHLLKIQRAPRLTTGFVQPSMVWWLRASRMLNTLGWVGPLRRRDERSDPSRIVPTAFDPAPQQGDVLLVGLRHELGNFDSTFSGEVGSVESDAFQFVECCCGKVTFSAMGTHHKRYIFDYE